ncbi:SGNH/GDSL hydrolase family protein [Bombilactobacillus bombi]|uniref:SGNH/GDSL hydrolase family protein n=1 Tax=Bombilactobacillus bombi TaxID=1303590 RepID=UPI0011C3B6DB|nr:SGNH/GDSL hydrolase family protein [Bombilactobacillus bombi]
MQFSVIRSANIVHPSTMFVRAYPSLSVKQSLSNPDIAATTNKNGQLFDENNQLISQISPDKAAFHIFQNFPNQPNSIIPHTYQIKLSLPTNVTLDSNQSVQLSSLNYRLLTATMKNSARLNKLTSDNHDGTHTYQYSLTNTVLNNLNLLLQFNLQINWDDPSIQKQLITIDKDQYFPIKIKTQVQIDSGTKTQQNWDLPEITSRVQVPNETIRFHYQNQHQKEIQKSVYCHGKLGTPVNYQVPTNFVDKYNQEYQYLNAVDDQGQPVNFNQLYYHYNHGKETNIYLTYQEKGLHHSALAGKKIVFLGSSVTRGLAAGGISFVDFLKSEDGVNTIKNAIDGTTLAGRGANTYVNRMKKQISPQTKLDAFVCQLSTNNVAQNKPLGTISNSKDIADFDINTTTGAIEYVIKYVQDTWHCSVIFYTGLYRDNPKYNQLVARLFELQKKWNFSIIDLYNNSDINNALKQNYNIYMADAIHPRKVFYQDYWTPIFRQELLKLFN